MSRAGVLLPCALLLMFGALWLGNPFLVAPEPPSPPPTRGPSPPAPPPAAAAVLSGPTAGARPLPDPRGVGPCPSEYAHLGVVRRGLDNLGRPTWWHGDGSFTTRVMQRVQGQDGSSVSVPAYVHAAPAPARPHEHR